MNIATGLAMGAKASADLASQAVQNALDKLDTDRANSVLLFLTEAFASNPEAAIKAAAKTASTMQIIGCSAPGIFTDEDWVIDGAAVAAMAFTGETLLEADTPNHPKADLLLTLVAPNAINATWLAGATPKFGGVSGDATGQGPFSVWQNGKGSTQGLCEIVLHNARGAVAPSHGLNLISSPRRVTRSHGYDVETIADTPALHSLQSAWHKAHKQSLPIPYHQMMAVYADKAASIERGDYKPCPIISGNEAEQSVTLASQLAEGQWLSWAVRDKDSAQLDIVKTASQLKQQLGKTPDFALFFSCLGRGPYFYDGLDQDLALLKTLFPKLPIIGFYGNGEIAPIHGRNILLDYSAVLGLFTCDEPV
jgi:small ligand-binding sensory domain FIST